DNYLRHLLNRDLGAAHPGHRAAKVLVTSCSLILATDRNPSGMGMAQHAEQGGFSQLHRHRLPGRRYPCLLFEDYPNIFQEQGYSLWHYRNHRSLSACPGGIRDIKSGRVVHAVHAGYSAVLTARLPYHLADARWMEGG